jgi:hypothetical protein
MLFFEVARIPIAKPVPTFAEYAPKPGDDGCGSFGFAAHQVHCTLPRIAACALRICPASADLP